MGDMKCKHCRKVLFVYNENIFLNAHNEKKNLIGTSCGINQNDSCLYISTDNIPNWIEELINQNCWTKGRIHCPHCNNRIGSFNFVNEIKCDCGSFVTSPVRLIHSKVDIPFQVTQNIMDNK